ncbi:hypothetical protein HY224_00630 [Candidatus Uhrbacteria bacterium]|nr:hypothetical protein [Candidatus Uhrbacteria bacterium]
MKRKMLMYAMLPVMGLGFLGANLASACGLGGFGGPGMGFGANVSPDQIATRQQTMFDSQAKLLGVSVDEVKAAWAQGKSFDDLAAEKGITQDQIKTKLQQAMKDQAAAYLKALVEKGVITQAQADARAKFMAQQQSKAGVGKGFRSGFRRGFRF